MSASGSERLRKDALFGALAGDPALAELPAAARDILYSGSAPRAFAPGEALLTQGSEGHHALILLSGEAQVIVESPHGDVVIAVLSAPRLLGELAALAGVTRTATVRAATDVDALQVDRALLLEIGRLAPGLMLRVIGQLGDRIRRFNKAVGLYTHAMKALGAGAFDPALLEDLRIPAADLGDFGATFARFADEIVLRRQRDEEMASAAAIQRALLPPPEDLSAIEGADLSAEMIPAREVGGDFFDVIALDGGRIAIGIGDVCGKGMPAALFMGIAKTLLRISIKSEPDIAVAVTRANALLAGENAAELFATLFYAVYDPASRRLDYCSCGHNAPFLRRANGDVSQLDAGGLPVGVFDTTKYLKRQIQLEVGDLLLLYTDGVTEAIDPDANEFGETRLAEALRDDAASAGVWSQRVQTSVRAFASGAAQSDDITTLALVAR